jgi:hypothetical protein
MSTSFEIYDIYCGQVSASDKRWLIQANRIKGIRLGYSRRGRNETNTGMPMSRFTRNKASLTTTHPDFKPHRPSESFICCGRERDFPRFWICDQRREGDIICL